MSPNRTLNDTFILYITFLGAFETIPLQTGAWIIYVIHEFGKIHESYTL